jgi:hypothetical protein
MTFAAPIFVARRTWPLPGAALLSTLAVVVALLVPLAATADPTVAASAPTAAPQGDENQAVTVRFRNDADGVTLRVNDGEWQALATGAAVDVVARGTTLRYRVARGYEWQFGGTLDLRDSTAHLVVIEAPGAHVAITNRSDEPRDIAWAGRTLGRLARDETRVFGPLIVGEHELLATGARSRHLIADRLTLRPGGRAERVLEAVPVGLLVRNPAPEPVRVLIDKRDFGALEQNAEAHLLGLAPGDHELVLRGLHSGRDWKGEATLDEGGAAGAITAVVAVVIDNGAGEDLVLPPALSGLHDGPIRNGSNVRVILPGRALRLRLVGADSALLYRFDVHPENGGEQKWAIERPVGAIRLRNATGEPARVTIGERPAFDLPTDRALLVRRVPAGRVVIAVTTQRSNQQFERVIQLAADHEVAWRVRAGAATLVVANDYAEPVEIAIDGTPRGRIAAGRTFRVADITPGEHDIRTRTLFTNHREAIRALVVDGNTARVRLQPPDASILVRNHGKASLRVAVNGVFVGDVAADHEQAFLVAPGEIYVALDDSDGREVRWSGRLAPGQSLPMPEAVVEAPRLLIENDTTTELTVRIDERGEWRKLSVGAKLEIDDLPEGEHLIELNAAGTALRRRVRLRSGAPVYRVTPSLPQSPQPVSDSATK